MTRLCASGATAARESRLLGIASILYIICTVLSANEAAAAILHTPFGPGGEGGSNNGQVLSFGSGGEVFELDAFVNIAGLDLNDGSPGTSAQLSSHALPAGLDFGFSTSTSPDLTDLTLTYTLTNNSAGTLNDVWFFSFVDAEIDVPINDFLNEAGFQLGTPGSGPGDTDADSWEIDEPGFAFGDIFSNLLLGTLDDTNAVPAPSPDDVSLALGFSLGNVLPNHVAIIDIFLSDDGDTLGGLALQHFDTDAGSFDTLTLSGTAAVVPEPSGLLLLGIGGALLAAYAARQRKHSCPITSR